MGGGEDRRRGVGVLLGLEICRDSFAGPVGTGGGWRCSLKFNLKDVQKFNLLMVKCASKGRVSSVNDLSNAVVQLVVSASIESTHHA